VVLSELFGMLREAIRGVKVTLQDVAIQVGCTSGVLWKSCPGPSNQYAVLRVPKRKQATRADSQRQ